MKITMIAVAASIIGCSAPDSTPVGEHPTTWWSDDVRNEMMLCAKVADSLSDEAAELDAIYTECLNMRGAVI